MPSQRPARASGRFRFRWMTYRLEFLVEALDEWRTLDKTIREHLKKKLAARLENPHVPASRIAPSRYKIKLRAAGYRLVYEVNDRELAVVVVAIGRRDKGQVYSAARKR
jgi:mRNA interferase RelE/StbE